MKRDLILGALVLMLSLWALPGRAAVASSLPDQAYVSGVVGHAQSYLLSCESRSAADWAAFWGVSISETEFLNQLPRSDNPNEGFVGNPNDVWGYVPPNSYGVHADPVARQLRNYGLDAHAGVGLSWDEVRAEIAAGRPVIVWVIGSVWAGKAQSYITQNGETVTVAAHEHTMILIGYDQKRVHLVDALTGATVTYPQKTFLASWAVLGNMAVMGNGAPQQARAENGGRYTVQSGDTLAKLAAAWDMSWQNLAAWNDIGYPYLIYTGQELDTRQPDGFGAGEVFANGETYVVQRGEHLIQIARDLELDWQEIARLNELEPPYLLYAGNVLELPGESSAATQQSAPEAPEFYTAEHHDSLYAIAFLYELDWMQLAAMNKLSYPYMLSPGQMIQLQ